MKNVNHYDKGGKTGQYFGNMMIGNTCWAIVLWDDEEDPDFFKADGLVIQQINWESIRT